MADQKASDVRLKVLLRLLAFVESPQTQGMSVLQLEAARLVLSGTANVPIPALERPRVK